MHLLSRLESGDVVGALLEAERLESSPPAIPLAKLRRAFAALLARRGYFVATRGELGASLEEIRDLGPGFDLYDLAARLERIRPGLLPIGKETSHGRSA